MRELLTFVAQSLVDHPDQVVVRETEGPEAVILELSVAEEDMGKVIGKQGRIAKNEPLCTLLQKYSVVQFSADNAPKNIELIGARREKDGMSALVRNSELPAGVESAPAGLEDIMVHIEREGEMK